MPTLDKETLLARSAELARIRITKGVGVVVQPASSITSHHGGSGPTHNAVRQASTTASAGETGLVAGLGAGASSAHSAEAAGAGSAIPKKTIWVRVKKELVHYWHGTKLLGTEIKISTKLANRLLHGSKLTRREQRQLRRTSGDLLRLIPFSVFVIVPFMEFLLPVALKLFPNMLPSTFEDRFAEEEKKRKLFKIRLEMAKFLQETVIQQQQQPNSATANGSGSKSGNATTSASVSATGRAEAIKEFGETFRKMRSTHAGGLPPTTAEMIRVARLFGDELTVDNLMRPQLLSMCRYMNLNAFGTDTFLRYQIRTSMKSIRKDDNLIKAEGVDSLTEPELQAACQSRGINTTEVSPDRLRTELNQWLELHLTYSIPATILILSRTFSYSDSYIPDRPGKVLHATLSSLPKNLLYETERRLSDQVAAGPTTASSSSAAANAAVPAVNPVLKLKVLQQQEELIAREKLQEEETRKLCMEQARVEKEIELLERQRLAEEQSANAAPIFLGSSYSTSELLRSSSTTAPDPLHHSQSSQEQEEPFVSVSSDSDQVVFKEPSSPVIAQTFRTLEAHLTPQQFLELRKALLVMTAPSPVVDVRVKLEGLKEQQQPSSANTTTITAPETTKITDRLLGTRVEKMISKLDQELQAYESYSLEKFKPMATNERNELTVVEVEAALKIIKHTPGDDETIRLIVQKLDIDGDGLVQLDHIFKLADLVELEEKVGGVLEDGVIVDGKRLKKTDVLKGH
ncbi:hypothetical protein BGZ95_000480 [Linnemannia exigua]|uniref:Letm1 RBD domain-containing protein n=1 Tax=Linnemannia exigua TaxID=604196 RepID=A0AAD4DJD7_9FUNG|nr:hypothetical protein BGZ95_000480 [Linnemannia exigua]